MLSSLLWIAIGIFRLPSWALEHAQPGYTCEAFHYEHDGFEPETQRLSIGYCERIVTETFVMNGRYAGSSSIVMAGTEVAFRPESPVNPLLGTSGMWSTTLSKPTVYLPPSP